MGRYPLGNYLTYPSTERRVSVQRFRYVFRTCVGASGAVLWEVVEESKEPWGMMLMMVVASLQLVVVLLFDGDGVSRMWGTTECRLHSSRFTVGGLKTGDSRRNKRGARTGGLPSPLGNCRGIGPAPNGDVSVFWVGTSCLRWGQWSGAVEGGGGGVERRENGDNLPCLGVWKLKPRFKWGFTIDTR